MDVVLLIAGILALVLLVYLSYMLFRGDRS
jgi:hypothetical protein